MRLHSLTITAFGSFSGRATVDFDQLSDTGIFLLHGPTGAGKTTILDAVSFALFGTVPGARTAGEALRSHHAPGDAVTEVELEVTLDGRRYRIVRRPKQQRPKLRGEGMREHPSYASVEELVAGAWVVRASKPNEADPYLQDHLHMAADQFHQIVLLPQGDFARFLRASADDRRKALEELFGTHRFTEVERWLRAEADRTRRALHEADEQARRVLAAVAAVADAEPFDDGAALTGAASWVDEHLAVARRRATDAERLEHLSRARHVEVRAALADAVERHGRQQRHAAAVAEQARLAAAHADHVARRVRCDDARRAAPVEPLLQAVARAAQAHDEAEAHRDAVHRMLATVAPELEDASAATLVDQDEQLIGQLAGIADLVDDEHALEAREQRLATLAERCGALSDQRAQLEAARATRPAGRTHLDEQLASARESASRLGDLAQLETQLAARHRSAIERDELLALVDGRAARLAHERRVALDAREAWLGLVEQQLASRAAALAAGLQPGDPCPVCGSAEHPAPATGDGSIVTDDELVVARERSEQAEQAAQVASDAVSELDQQLAAAIASAGDAAAADLGVELDHLRDQLGRVAAEAAAESDLAAALAEHDQHTERMDALLEVADRELVATRQEHDRLEADLIADRGRLHEARAGFASLAARADALQQQRQAIAAMLDAETALQRATESRDDAVAASEAEATRRRFPSVDAARDAVLDDDAIARLVAEIEAHERSEAETLALLGDAELVEAAAAPAVDLDEIVLAADAAERDWDVASTAAATAQGVVAKLEQARSELHERLGAILPLTDAYERARRLADLASGDDRQVEHRMRLSTYVLAARLEQVAAAASERLSRMSGGRFTIVHTDEAPDGRRKGGLGLRVVDAWTSTHRETASLSGGESFFTSLALALGVADVVSAEAGGITIDTMFIDEGFGSLDEDTLQQVLDVIDGLRAGGRTIGIVSHVADLRDRITSQLEVIKGPEGSSLRTIAAGPPPAPPTRIDRPAHRADGDAA